MAVPINALIFGAASMLEIYANFIKNSQHMTLEEANAAWADVQRRVKDEHVSWDEMVAEIKRNG